jgi:hypothetical protein
MEKKVLPQRHEVAKFFFFFIFAPLCLRGEKPFGAFAAKKPFAP